MSAYRWDYCPGCDRAMLIHESRNIDLCPSCQEARREARLDQGDSIQSEEQDSQKDAA
jgi:Zn-finger nucleic acid-binding protein